MAEIFIASDDGQEYPVKNGFVTRNGKSAKVEDLIAIGKGQMKSNELALDENGMMPSFGEPGLQTDIPFLPVGAGAAFGAGAGGLIANKIGKAFFSRTPKATKKAIGELKGNIAGKLKRGELVTKQELGELNNLGNALNLDLRTGAQKKAPIIAGAGAGGIAGGYLANSIFGKQEDPLQKAHIDSLKTRAGVK